MALKSTPKVLFVADSAGGGAGIAALRLQAACLDRELEVRFLVFRDAHGPAKSWDDTARPLPPKGPLRKLGKTVALVRTMTAGYSRWRRSARRDRFFHGVPDSFEITTIYPGRQRLDSHPWYHWADIIHLHWTAGFLAPQQAWNEKTWVISLHDANPFTAVCHFPADCCQFETGCRECPQLAGTRNPRLSARVFDRKRAGYGEGGNITLHAPSRWIADLAARSVLMGKFPSRVLPNVFPTDIFRPLDPVASRDLLGLPARKVALFVAGHVGNVRKGFVWFRRLAEASRGTDWLFVIIGGGELPELPHNCVTLGRLMDLRLMAAAYSAADVFVSTTLQDTVPATVIESQLCGTPVVGFAVGGQPEMVEQSVSGYLSNEVSLQGLQDGLEWLSRTKPSRSEIASRAYEKWNAPALTQRWLDFYEGLA